MNSIAQFKQAMVDEGENTPMQPLPAADYLTHMEPFEVRIERTVRDSDGTFIAFRGIGRRAYALFQQGHVTVFWTVAGNGTQLHCIDSEGHAHSFLHLVLLKSIVKSLGRAQSAEDTATMALLKAVPNAA